MSNALRFLLVSLLLALTACSVAGPDPTGDPSATSLGQRPPTSSPPSGFPGGAFEAAESLAILMEDMPPSRVNSSLPEKGGLVTTEKGQTREQWGHIAVRRPTIHIDRDLDVGSEGVDIVGGAGLTIIATAPLGDDLITRVEVSFTFTQHSLLAKDALSASLVRRSVATSHRRHMTPLAVKVSLATPPLRLGDSMDVEFDLRKRQWASETEEGLKSISADEERDAARSLNEAVSKIEGTVKGTIRPRDTVDPSRGRDHEFPRFSGEDLSELGACPEFPCEATGQIVFDHPAWGRSVLITVVPWVGVSHLGKSSYIVVLDSNEATRWKHSVWSNMDLEPAETPVDNRGDIFLDYNPGRYDGVIVLRPTVKDFEDFGTLPAETKYAGRFYSAKSSDSDRDGNVDISQTIYCHPDCTSKKDKTTVIHWTLDQGP